jgi:hypothetical protein
VIDIIIPTNKTFPQVEALINDIRENTSEDHKVIATCKDAWTAVNRNYGLEISVNDVVVQLDDDITGFYPGWLSDLTRPVFETNCIVSARFLDERGRLQIMMDWGRSLQVHGLIEPPSELPSSCIAFRRDIVNKIIDCKELPLNKPFDENYIKAEYDDTDFMKAVKFVDPYMRFYVNNDCKLIHLNKESWRDESIRGVNKKYFNHKWSENR